MATNINDTARNALLAAITSGITSTGRIKIYTGTAPAKSGGPTGTLLSTLTTNSTFAPAPSGGVLTANSIANDTAAVQGGVPGYYRIIDGTSDVAGHCWVQGPCNIPAAGVGNVTATITSNTLTFASSQSNLAGTYIVVGADTVSYLITNGATTTWFIGTPYAGSTQTTSFTTMSQSAGISFSSQISQNGTVSITSLVYTEGNP
jgi:hypothetical protein